MQIYRFFPIISFLALSMSVLSICKDREGEVGASAPSFEFAPQYYFDETLLEFFHPKNAFFKERYFLENRLSLDAAFFSFAHKYYFFGNILLNFDLGRQSGAILLDPREVDMGFGPIFEYRLDHHRVVLQAGLDHHCFHQIDRNEWNTLYWNKFFIGAG